RRDHAKSHPTSESSSSARSNPQRHHRNVAGPSRALYGKDAMAGDFSSPPRSLLPGAVLVRNHRAVPGGADRNNRALSGTAVAGKPPIRSLVLVFVGPKGIAGRPRRVAR